MPFPPPWTVHHNDDAYWVEDASGHRFGFCYFRELNGSTLKQPAYLREDEARRIASNIAKLPGLLQVPSHPQDPQSERGEHSEHA